jgi:hypothetical protein
LALGCALPIDEQCLDLLAQAAESDRLAAFCALMRARPHYLMVYRGPVEDQLAAELGRIGVEPSKFGALVPRLIAAADAVETFFVTETAAQRR